MLRLIKFVVSEMSVKPKMMIIGKTMNRILGIFTSVLRETQEMLYQYEIDYHFDSIKFERKFDWKPTIYTEGVTATARFYKIQNKS
ncbi:MAG: hypothetical protein JNL70_24065 [Saprospiraceae bacterium]|nr:hypothetical protein [Saprospiraceae bacterium]